MLLALSFASAQRPSNIVRVELRLSKSVITLGEAVEATYLIRNVSQKSLLLQRQLDATVNVQVYSEVVKIGRDVTASDTLTNEPVVSKDCKVRQDWLAIPPGHFYGRTVILSQKLTRPGKYSVAAEFGLGNYSHEKYIESCGFVVPDSQNSNPITLTVKRGAHPPGNNKAEWPGRS